MSWRLRWRLAWRGRSMLWSTSGLVTCSPSGWLSCRPPASLQNMPTSSASSSKRSLGRQLQLLFIFVLMFVCRFQLHPQTRWGFLHRTAEEHRPGASSWVLPCAECETCQHRFWMMMKSCRFIGPVLKRHYFVFLACRLQSKSLNPSLTTSRRSQLCSRCLDIIKSSRFFLFVQMSSGTTITQVTISSL